MSRRAPSRPSRRTGAAARWRARALGGVGVLMALATGIALGAGPLQHEVATRPAAAPADRPTDADGRLRAALADAAAADRTATALTRPLVARALAGREVTLLVLPGADEADVTRTESVLARAGARVVLRAEVERALLDVGRRQLVGELGSQLSRGARTAVRVPPGAGDYERIGRVLARAVVGERAGDALDAGATAVLDGLAASGLVRTVGTPAGRGALVVAVAGAPYGDADERAGAATITATLLAQLARPARAVLLTGPASAGGEDGLVTAVRTGPGRRLVATTDTAGSGAGAVAAVLALAEDVTGPSRHYGGEAAPDGPAPQVR